MQCVQMCRVTWFYECCMIVLQDRAYRHSGRVCRSGWLAPVYWHHMTALYDIIKVFR